MQERWRPRRRGRNAGIAREWYWYGQGMPYQYIIHLVGGLVAINFIFPEILGILGIIGNINLIFNMKVNWDDFLFSQKYWECHHPNWRTHIVQRGGPGPPTRHVFHPASSNVAGIFSKGTWENFLELWWVFPSGWPGLAQSGYMEQTRYTAATDFQAHVHVVPGQLWILRASGIRR